MQLNTKVIPQPSIIVLDQMSIDRLHLHSLLCRLQFSLAIGSSPPSPPHFHRWDIIIRSFRNPNTLKKGTPLDQRGELNVIVCRREVE